LPTEYDNSQSMHKKIIVGNWKMNGSRALASKIVVDVAAHMANNSLSAKVVLAPPVTYLSLVRELIPVNSTVALCAQDCSAHEEGAYTGEVSAQMLAESGCSYAIIGHSERRFHHHETDTLVHAKMKAVIAAGLIPIVCVGESLKERENASHLAVVEAQVHSSVLESGFPENKVIIAYEPVWAIGTGKTATSQDITSMHKHIASVLSSANNGADISQHAVIYGGSVKAANAKEILSLPGVDGVLVGGASVKSEEFIAIISAA